MSQTMIPVLMFGLFAVVFAWMLWAAAAGSKRAHQNIRRQAEMLGLQLPVQAPVMGLIYKDAIAGGSLRGKRVEIYTFSTGSGKSRTQWSAVAATPKASGGLTFKLQPQGIGTKIMEVFGSREIEVGDPEFDRQWFVQTNQPDFLRAALVPELRGKLSALVRESGVRSPQLQLEQGVVRYAEHGSFSDARRADRIGRAAEVACDFADLAEVFATQGK